jgi:hypothetical protein
MVAGVRRVRVRAAQDSISSPAVGGLTARCGITILLLIGFFIALVLAWYHASAARSA